MILVVLAAPESGGWRPSSTPQKARKYVPLFLPPMRELTQKDPNRAKVAKELNLEGLQAARKAEARESPRPSPPPRPAPKVIARGPAPPPPLIEPPKIDVSPAQVPPPGNMGQFPDAPPPQIQASEKPRLAFETPGAPRSSGVAPSGRVAVPQGTVDEAMRSIVRGQQRSGVVIVETMELPSGTGSSAQSIPRPGRAGSRLELLSDPQGVDFRPYLAGILAEVRRNWMAVIPESARFGRRGVTLIQFAISRDGRVPKLVISTPSGTESFDRAAVAGISASNPFPPLPPGFKGEVVRLQLTFSYNMPVN